MSDGGGLPYAARLIDVRVENARTRTFVLDTALDATPGQFAMLWLPGLDEKPFSLLAADPLSFTIAAVGPFTRALHRLQPGDQVWLRGPFGHGFALTGTDHLMVGGGYGVAPMLYLARTALATGHRVRAVVGARVADEVLLTADFRAAGVDLALTTEDGSLGVKGRVIDVVGPLLATDRPATLYACGPHGMLAALDALAATHAVPAQLAWEAYMRCALGICGSCEHDGQLLCADGPVLAMSPTDA
jgi:dihydroorotate dehydrogenase electron transfer subunit